MWGEKSTRQGPMEAEGDKDNQTIHSQQLELCHVTDRGSALKRNSEP